MSRFTVGQEITPKSDGELLTYGKFYRIEGFVYGNALVVDNYGNAHEITDCYGLTREEYEQAEREKDPFAPGEWVVCAEDDCPAKVGDIIQVHAKHWSSPQDLFVVHAEGTRWGMLKSHFRPATPEEIKGQEMKIMDANRQTFTVGGQEFYIGQSAWAVGDGLLYKDGDALDVIGMVAGLNFPTNVSVRNKKTLMCFVMKIAGLTTTPPKPHEWKFGDWARHPDEGVCFVMSGVDGDGDVMLAIRGNWTYRPATELTYISTAEIPE